MIQNLIGLISKPVSKVLLTVKPLYLFSLGVILS